MTAAYRYPDEFRLKCLEEVDNGDSVPIVAKRHGINESTLGQWKRDVIKKRTIELRRKERKEFEERMKR